MPTIEIQALDTLFFRDGKPFEMGDDNWAEGIFPPPPSVIYGALRSAYFAQHPDDMDKMGEKNDPTKDLRITGYYLRFDNLSYLPAPFDLVYDKDKHEKNKKREKKKNSYEVEHISLIKSNNLISNYSLECIPYAEKNIEKVSQALIPISDFIEYLNGNTVRVSVASLSPWLKNESKIGVGLDNNTRSSSEGKLYRVGMKRLSNVVENKFKELTIIVEYSWNKDGNNFVPKLLRLGAENKVVKIRDLDNSILIKNDIGNYFKIVLLTPSIFIKNDWFPNLELDNVQLIAAFIDHPIYIGGWDIAKKEPKKMYKAVPAGSVFYYKVNDNEKPETVLGFLNKTPSISEKYDKEGFGLFSIGKINPEILNDC